MFLYFFLSSSLKQFVHCLKSLAEINLKVAEAQSNGGMILFVRYLYDADLEAFCFLVQHVAYNANIFKMV